MLRTSPAEQSKQCFCGCQFLNYNYRDECITTTKYLSSSHFNYNINTCNSYQYGLSDCAAPSRTKCCSQHCLLRNKRSGHSHSNLLQSPLLVPEATDSPGWLPYHFNSHFEAGFQGHRSVDPGKGALSQEVPHLEVLQREHKTAVSPSATESAPPRRSAAHNRRRDAVSTRTEHSGPRKQRAAGPLSAVPGIVVLPAPSSPHTAPAASRGVAGQPPSRRPARRSQGSPPRRRYHGSVMRGASSRPRHRGGRARAAARLEAVPGRPNRRADTGGRLPPGKGTTPPGSASPTANGGAARAGPPLPTSIVSPIQVAMAPAALLGSR